MKVGLVVPHIFMHRDILPSVIFSPARLALDLAEGLQLLGVEVSLFSPGPVDTTVTNIAADLSLFEAELKGRGDDYVELLKKHPVTFVSLARQVQAELIGRAFALANENQLDIVHIYTNEEDIALPFAALCTKPVLFTHHDPFNFLVKYKNTFPKYAHLNWVSLSYAQRKSMPPDTNWVGNIYHGLKIDRFRLTTPDPEPYVAFLGRIIEPKGVHLAIAAIKAYNQNHDKKLRLKIAGKHYSGTKDTYWQEKVAPEIDHQTIEYIGYLGHDDALQEFLGGAQALVIPSIFDEPFGMVMLESLACGTPIIGLDSGAIPEIVDESRTGFIIAKGPNEQQTVINLVRALEKRTIIDRGTCRQVFEDRFALERMCQEHVAIYRQLIESQGPS